MNIEFSYLYRDAGNFKQFGSIVFSNTNKLPLNELHSKILKALIDEMFFDPLQAHVPVLFFDDEDEELDHDWHEFENLQETSAAPNDVLQRDITIFIARLARLSK